MSYLVDTNVFSEDFKKTPDPRIGVWTRKHEASLYVSAVTLGELTFGIERVAPGQRRAKLERWLEDIVATMDGRILAFNARVARVWGVLQADLEERGRKMPLADSQIAATAIRHQLTIVTRNVRDFEDVGVRVLNPFED